MKSFSKLFGLHKKSTNNNNNDRAKTQKKKQRRDTCLEKLTFFNIEDHETYVAWLSTREHVSESDIEDYIKKFSLDLNNKSSSKRQTVYNDVVRCVETLELDVKTNKKNTRSVCEQKVDFFNITDKTSFNEWKEEWHVDKRSTFTERSNIDRIDKKIDAYIKKFSIHPKDDARKIHSQVSNDVEDCVVQLGLHIHKTSAPPPPPPPPPKAPTPPPPPKKENTPPPKKENTPPPKPDSKPKSKPKPYCINKVNFFGINNFTSFRKWQMRWHPDHYNHDKLGEETNKYMEDFGLKKTGNNDNNGREVYNDIVSCAEALGFDHRSGGSRCSRKNRK